MSLLGVLKTGRKNDPRVVGELVLVYMQSNEYDRAHDYAEENYRKRPGNPINANNYFACLIMKNKSSENREALVEVINQLTIDPSERAQEMLYSMKARLVAYYDDDEMESFKIIEEAIKKFPEISYPTLTKADLATHFNNKDKLREAVDILAKSTGRTAHTYRTFIQYKAILLAMQDNVHEAKLLVKKELSGLIGTALQRLNDRLESIASNPRK